MRILQRYVLTDLIKVFALLVAGLTVMLVFVGVVGEASKNGLGPLQILQILPYIIPSLLPFTIPATLLLTVCVVYGRMAGDHEITATKAAGINVLAVLWPSFTLGAVLSLCTLILTDQFIPWARANIERIVTNAVEDIFLDGLRRSGQVNLIDHGIAIIVTGVSGKKLIDPTFRYTPPGSNTVTIKAQEATIRFDMTKRVALLQLYRGHIETAGALTVWFEREERPFPLPVQMEGQRVRNMPIASIRKELGEIHDNQEEIHHKHVAQLTFALTRGEFLDMGAPEVQQFPVRRQANKERSCRLNTEIHSRLALACSCFFFVIVGSPYSILQGKRQFLTNFFLCFLPILIVYYPVILLTMDLGKNDILNPAIGLWAGNVLLSVVAAWVLYRVLRY